MFSQEKISVTLKAGETGRGELYFGTEDNERIRGYVTSSNRRLVPGIGKFSGTTVCLPYGADGTGMKPGEVCSGWLSFTTNIGEHKIPFVIETEKEQMKSSVGEVKTMDAFRKIAGDDFREAYRLLRINIFPQFCRMQSRRKERYMRGFPGSR